MSAEFNEPTDSDDHDRPGDYAEAWEEPYPSHDAVTADHNESDSPDDEDDILAGLAANTERPVVTADDIDGLMRANEYLSEIHGRAGGAMFAAVVKGESLGKPSVDPDLEEVEDDSLAAFDAPGTERGNEQFDQQLNTEPYRQALEATGVRLRDDPFIPGLELVDGRRFTAALAAMPAGNEAMREVAERVISPAIIDLNSAYVPPFIAEDYDSNHLAPTLRPEIADDPARARAHADLLAEILANAPEMTAELERLDVDPGLIGSVKALSTAVDEGITPQWAVASNWNLFHAATTNYLERRWTQWLTPGEWQPLNEFLDAAAAKAPPDSRFMSDLALTMLDNIDRLRRGDLDPGWEPPRHESEDDDDFIELDLDRFDWSPTDEQLAEEREYQAALDAVEENLRRFVR